MKKLIALLLCLTLLLTLAGCASDNGETVTVEKVSRIVAKGSVGLINRYAGLVVSGETASVERGDKKVAQVLVKEGDWVSEGDVLFSYDMEALELELTKLLLELDGYENTIASAQEEIPELEKQRAAAGAGQQLSYSLQIQSLQADIREATYNKGLKEREIDNLREALEDTDIRAPISGRIMSVASIDNSGSGMDTDMYMGMDGSGNSAAFITIMDMTTYQIKGTINELNVGTLTEGMRVIVRSRLDESVTWNGVLDHVDWENQSKDQNSMYYYGPVDEMTTSAKYPFYVALDDVTGLILGQHVYVEPDYGQMEVRKGLWLPEYYISDVSAAPWVWCTNTRSKLEKRNVALGDYDQEKGEYEILSGLTEDDYIAFPAEGLESGMAASPYEESVSYASGGSAVFSGVYVSGGNAYSEAAQAPGEEYYIDDDMPSSEESSSAVAEEPVGSAAESETAAPADGEEG